MQHDLTSYETTFVVDKTAFEDEYFNQNKQINFHINELMNFLEVLKINSFMTEVPIM